MQEDFLHFIWKYKRFDIQNLKTVNNQTIRIINLGQHNFNSGPDFFNAQLIIDTQKWVGNVEIHIKSSDWFVHNHETDAAYDNVILHVVWEHDTDIFRKDNTVIPTLELKKFTNIVLHQNYLKLIQSKTWINCENEFITVNDFALNNWIERLYIERLERKSKDIYKLLETSQNDWEAVLFKMLCKSFGLKINSDSFLSIANSVDFSVVRKIKHNATDFEALLFGQANLLEDDIQDVYYLDLQNRFQFLKQKFQLNNQGVIPLQFFRLRPPNFPTIRLSQMAALFNKEKTLFSKIIEAKTIEAFYELFKVKSSEFWKTHYTFSNTSSKPITKKLSKSFVDLLMINTILPIKFSYLKSLGKPAEDVIFDLITSISIEKNTIISKFMSLRDFEKSAKTSQGLIQLKTEYCDKNKCIQCAIGNALISKNP